MSAASITPAERRANRRSPTAYDPGLVIVKDEKHRTVLSIPVMAGFAEAHLAGNGKIRRSASPLGVGVPRRLGGAAGRTMGALPQDVA